MKRFLILLLSFLISCGPSEEEIQSQIDEAVENALQTTTTTLAPTTTTTTTLAPTTTTTTTLAPTTTTANEKNESCNYKNNNIYIDIQNTDNDGVLSSGSSTNKTYSLSQLPYAELLKVNKNNDGYIESIQICHSNLEIFEIFSNNPYCFFRFSNIDSTSKPTLRTFILTDVFPKDKAECNQLNEDAIFKADEIRFYTKTKKPSMSFVLKKNGEYTISVDGNDNNDCCLNNTFNIFSYGTTTTTTTTSSTTTTTTTTIPYAQLEKECYEVSEVGLTLPKLIMFNYLSSSTVSSNDTVSFQYKIEKGTHNLDTIMVFYQDQFGNSPEGEIVYTDNTEGIISTNIGNSRLQSGFSYRIFFVELRDVNGNRIQYNAFSGQEGDIQNRVTNLKCSIKHSFFGADTIFEIRD